MECPTSTTGTGPNSASIASSASFRSPTGEAWGPFQPRTRKRGRRTTAPLPRTPCRMAAATGIIRSTAGCSAEVGAALDAWPPCATRTTPLVDTPGGISPLVICSPRGRPGQASRPRRTLVRWRLPRTDGTWCCGPAGSSIPNRAWTRCATWLWPGRIAAVGTGLTARVSGGDVDMAGQVVTAGFIDLHSHVSDLGGLRLQAMDGVTTALELEAGVTPVAQAYRRAADEGRPINYGFAASWAMARMETVAGLPPGASLGAFMARISDPGWQRPAEPAQVGSLLARLAEDLADGALGIGVLLGYAPAASPAEYLRVAGLAAQAGMPTFTHARDLIEMVPATLADGAEEIVR